jgi:hypothetical protein
MTAPPHEVEEPEAEQQPHAAPAGDGKEIEKTPSSPRAKIKFVLSVADEAGVSTLASARVCLAVFDWHPLAELLPTR